ncbi:orotidine-5'-phosphate decarboxylase [Jeotgalibaca ciconiae]|uniref:Orotidine 5'-phosphate decarboxylase n=1 Tax=Jeotgalibaca ciconiae TaxID=2496265 RepID=A0A3S9HDG8_9LACT|nr:orotidine-5'-phosphate decarboxylase [Jeotgalibaca ciconiae]AZP05419.1 orotidine-5'-phosphate decarboxylase [Jeotgalibaca ciconiae]HJB24080.1 orotidine-5'-phosphate decarboxylase [Candidatus Jeotgalibaca pullicola]
MNTKPMIALDFSTAEETKTFLTLFKDEELYVKLGMELYYQNGPEIVKWVKNLGHEIFLDLKLHDIPNTVYRAMKGLAALDIDMINVHASGGSQMMKAAKEGIMEGTPNKSNLPKLIAVTQLTSTTEEAMRNEQLIQASLMDSVLHYAKNTCEAGLDGVVCSAWEAAKIKEITSSDFLCVTPGIRPAGASIGDQQRVATPQKAHEMGSSYIVVGRPITQASNPVEVYQSIKRQWNGE